MTTRSGHRLLLLVLALPCALASLAAHAAPRAWLDRDSIRLGETVTLNVETDARGGNAPDFSVLDANFRRLGTSSNTQLSIVNGRQTARALFAVALEPRNEGVIGIPALSVGNERTAPLTLTVLPTPSGASAGAGDDVFLEVDATPPDPYVQQQVVYTVRLYYAVQLLEGQLEEPAADGAQMRRLGQDVQYQKMLAQRRYSVVERRYALLPERSGTIEVPGPQFRGRALRTGGYGSLLSPNATLGARASAITLQARARPAGAPSPWLPAQAVTLDDESPAASVEAKVGEPLTLTLRLTALGLSAEQLPELKLPDIDGAEVYPDQEASQTRDEGQWMRGERVRKFAIVPTRAGPLTLPEVAIEWWDVAADRRARAVLAPREWQVLEADGSVPKPAPAMPGVPATDAASGDDAATLGAPKTDWPWRAVAVLFALLWLATLLLWRRRARAGASSPGAEASRPTPRRAAPDWRGAWSAALERSDTGAAARAMIIAAQQRDPAVRNLAEVAAMLGDGAQRVALQRLEQALYRNDGDGPEALLPALDKAFSGGPRWREADATGGDDDVLPPLYPVRRAR